MIPATLLDSDTLSYLRKQHPQALIHAKAYLREHGELSFSLITHYEVLRGLKVRGATAQIQSFERLCGSSRVVPLKREVILRATDIYADLSRRGVLIGDADILIAATALEHRLILTTNNTRHYDRVPGLTLQNWLFP